MADYPPYMNAYGNVSKILNKIKEAKTPERFSQDYLETVLGFSGGSARPFVSLAKRIGLLASDGTPTDLYHRFRNPAQSEQAMAQAIRKGYHDLYKRNEFAHALDKPKLEGLIMEITGLDKGSQTLKAIANTFDALKAFANFELETPPEPAGDDDAAPTPYPPRPGGDPIDAEAGLRFSHNIYSIEIASSERGQMRVAASLMWPTRRWRRSLLPSWSTSPVMRLPWRVATAAM